MEAEKLIDALVIHKSFGEGIIKEADEKYLNVEFADGKTSRFMYPAGFDKFLTLKDKRKQNAVEKDVAVWREESGEVRREKLRLQYQKTQDAIIARREAAEEKKQRAYQRSQLMRVQRMASANKDSK